AQTSAAMVTKLGFLSYSRSQEAAADRVGVKLLEKTEYDPQGMVRFFRKIEELQKSGSSVVTRFLSDHPEPATRIASVSKEIATLPPARRTGEVYRERWIAYRDRVCPRGPKSAPETLPAPPPP